MSVAAARPYCWHEQHGHREHHQRQRNAQFQDIRKPEGSQALGAEVLPTIPDGCSDWVAVIGACDSRDLGVCGEHDTAIGAIGFLNPKRFSACRAA